MHWSNAWHVSGKAGPWRHWQSVVGSHVWLLSGQRLMHNMDHWEPLGLWPHMAPFSCYDVIANNTHRQVTISGTQCGRPFVWFMGDVVANVASVSFRGSGKLQIFPSQQEVQTWKKGREKEEWGEAGRSCNKQGGLKEWTPSRQDLFYRRDPNTTLKGRGGGWGIEISTGSSVVKMKTTWAQLRSMGSVSDIP